MVQHHRLRPFERNSFRALGRLLVTAVATLLLGCGEPVEETAVLGTEELPVWTNLGGLITANPFFNQVVDDHPQTTSGLPLLHSRSDAGAVLFLDFDGGGFDGGGPTTFPPFDYENIGFSSAIHAISTGSKGFSTQTGLGYVAGDRVRIAAAGEFFGNYMEGTVASYASGNLVVNVDKTALNDSQKATFGSWRIQNLKNSAFNAAERSSILDTWHSAAMWFSQFNLDVTTQQPASGDTRPLVWVAMTFSGWGGAGCCPPHWTGASPLVSDLPGPNSNIPHEVSHSMGGMRHTATYDFLGLETSQYSPSADTPIITSFHGDGAWQTSKMPKWVLKTGSTEEVILDPAAVQSEVDVIRQMLTAMGVNPMYGNEPGGFADFWHSPTSAAPLTSLGAHSYARSGHLFSEADIDVFKFQPTLSGYYSIMVGRDAPAAVDTAVTILDSGSNVIATADGDPSEPNPHGNVYDQHLTLFFSAGTYYIRVASHGGYADFGQYVVRASYIGDTDEQWQVNDIGIKGVPGYASFDPDGNTYEIAGSGRDMDGNDDDITIVSQKLRGDGFISARVTHLDSNNPCGFAGITMRNSLKRNAKHATLVMTKHHGWQRIHRTLSTLDNVSVEQGDLAFTARYLKLTRTGSTIAFHFSTDGTNWGTPIHTQSVSLATDIHVGLVVSNVSKCFIDPLTGGERPDLHGQRLAKAAIRNVVLGVTGDGVLNPRPYVLDTLSAKPSLNDFPTTTDRSATLVWTDPNQSEAGYIVERSADRINWTEATTTAANTTTFTDTGLGDGRTYYYRVRAVGASGRTSTPSTIRAAVTKAGAVDNGTIRTYTLENRTIVLHWDDVDGEVGYKVYRAGAGSGFQQIGATAANGFIFVDDQPKSAATTYSYKFESLFTGGSTLSDQKDVATRASQRPMISVIGRTSTTIDLFWPPISVGPFTPSKYLVYRRLVGAEWTPVGNSQGTNFHDSGLAPATAYEYEVIGCTSGSAPVCSAGAITTQSTTP